MTGYNTDVNQVKRRSQWHQSRLYRILYQDRMTVVSPVVTKTLMAMYAVADDEGNVSYAALRELTGADQYTTRQHVSQLQRVGLVRVSHHKTGTPDYYFTLKLAGRLTLE